MNTINKITLTQFRNYSAASFSFLAPVVCITGSNGSGKTNLLDAIYYLCYTKSYFSSYQQYNALHGTDGFRVEGVFQKNEGEEELIICKWKGGKKEVYSNGVEYDQPNDHIGKYAAVMIAPDDMELINEGSELRRKWMDGILGQVDKNYLDALLQYQRVLMQRNAWLKIHSHNPPSNSAELEYYDSQITLHGNYLHLQRAEFIRLFRPLIEQYYIQLSGGREQVEIEYQSDLFQKPLKELLTASLYHDFRLQRTVKGIHKDDLDFLLDGKPVKQFASQGQKKSYLFALKLAQYSYLSEVLHRKPVLLLDDIFEKLDQERMEALLGIIRGKDFGQVILTDTHEDRVREAFGPGIDIACIRL